MTEVLIALASIHGVILLAFVPAWQTYSADLDQQYQPPVGRAARPLLLLTVAIVGNVIGAGVDVLFCFAHWADRVGLLTTDWRTVVAAIVCLTISAFSALLCILALYRLGPFATDLRSVQRRIERSHSKFGNAVDAQFAVLSKALADGDEDAWSCGSRYLSEDLWGTPGRSGSESGRRPSIRFSVLREEATDAEKRLRVVHLLESYSHSASFATSPPDEVWDTIGVLLETAFAHDFGPHVDLAPLQTQALVALGELILLSGGDEQRTIVLVDSVWSRLATVRNTLRTELTPRNLIQFGQLLSAAFVERRWPDALDLVLSNMTNVAEHAAAAGDSLAIRAFGTAFLELIQELRVRPSERVAQVLIRTAQHTASKAQLGTSQELRNLVPGLLELARGEFIATGE